MRYLANIWPAAVEKVHIDVIKEILSGYCTVIKCREIQLNYLGLRNYMLQIYKEGKWIGSCFTHFRGIKVKLDHCYGKASTWIIELESESHTVVLQAKEAVRKYCNMDKSSIHTSDTEGEISRMKALLFHENSLWLMNHCRPDKYLRFMAKLIRLEKLCRKEGVAQDSLIIVSEAVLSLYNVRFSGKMSIMSKEDIPPRLNQFNDKEYEDISAELQNEIYLPENQVYFYGFRFVTLEFLNKVNSICSSDISS